MIEESLLGVPEPVMAEPIPTQSLQFQGQSSLLESLCAREKGLQASFCLCSFRDMLNLVYIYYGVHRKSVLACVLACSGRV